MEKIIREILVLPLRILLLGNRFAKVVDQYKLVEWAWKIGRSADDGCLLVDMTLCGTEGRAGNYAAARQLANEVLLVTRSAKTVEVLASYEISNRNYSGADEYIIRAEEAGCEDMHHLLIIKLYCCEHLDKYQEEEVIKEMLSCSCLSMAHTREALLASVDYALDNEDHDQVDEITSQLLAVREDAYARYFKGIVSLKRNEVEIARSHFLKARGNMPEKEYFAAIGMTYINHDRKEEGMDWLLKAINAGFEVSRENELLWEVYHSKEYADYCAMRN